ncbi:Uncharacterized protein SCF082_LOCUS32497 [Durusdinium trenchii]|uniref:Uncharacterized protein n=1 Tax=Durusdinium trenchii TaxID=1381693 RepID=A0ABP0NFI5_9DINO
MPPTTEQPASSLPPLRASAKGEKRKRAERLLTRPPAKKHFRSKTFRQRRRHQKVLTCHLRRFPSAEQAADTVARAIRVVENEWPEFGKLVAQKLQPATVCGSCSSLVRGLGAVPEFKPPNPSDRIRAIRDQVDVLIHQAFPDRSAVENLGYSFGAARWLKASGPDDAQAKTRGRPSKVNSKACIEAVRAVLQAHSQDSSKICRSNPGGTAEWVIARTLTKDRTALFEDEPSLYENMSARTMHRIMKEHLCHFKKARCQSDYCQYCADYDDKVLPKAQEMIADARDQLEKIMPNYWQAWDAFLAAEPFKDLPALEIEAFEHYISRHHERHPCAEHRDNDFPCGLADLRKRGSGFRQNLRVDLFSLEATLSTELRAMLRLMLSYNHHKAATEHQDPVLMSLQKSPPCNSTTLVSDWKELVTLPISHKATGEQFYATARMEVSVWGACMVDGNAAQRRRDPSSPLICVILNKDSPVPQEAKRLLPTDLAITRTYCLSGKLDARIKPTALGVRLYNHVFSTRPVSVELKDYSIEALACPAEWRRGFWGSGRSNWDTDPEPLHLHKNTALSRRYDEQKSLLPRAKGRKHNALPSLDDEIKKHEASLQRRRQRNKIRQQAWSKKTSQEPSSSSTSSSSDSSAE